ncbi:MULTISPECIES: hypothetical protein [Bradyrhizobium]|uniref:hypothetical protein n=1 Tax=Bradyrhizobium TaxID=374 RepID=UPI0012D2CAC6|nr:MULTISPECIES: hypothetical protein [Bradyrhizobium]
MGRFIHNENVRRYRKLLEEETNEDRRAIIRKLLADEEAKKISSDPKRSDDRSKQI